MKIDLGQINPGVVAQISIDYMFEPVKPSTIKDMLDQLIALQDQDGHFNWGAVMSDLTGKTEEEWMAMGPRFARRNDWITAAGIVLLKINDNTEAATLKARGYLSTGLNKKKTTKLIKKAFFKLEYLVLGLMGKEQLFMQSETLNWRQRLGRALLSGAVEVIVTATIADRKKEF
jgi:hypothetical protein